MPPLCILSISIHAIETVLYVIFIAFNYKWWCYPNCHPLLHYPARVVVSIVLFILTLLVFSYFDYTMATSPEPSRWWALLLRGVANCVLVIIPRCIEYGALKEDKKLSLENAYIDFFPPYDDLRDLLGSADSDQ